MFEAIDRETESELIDSIDKDRLVAHVDELADLSRPEARQSGQERTTSLLDSGSTAST
jgi:hypothetical protein